jgi:hypothetical protein
VKAISIFVRRPDRSLRLFAVGEPIELPATLAALILPQQLGQLRHVGRNSSRLVSGEHLGPVNHAYYGIRCPLSAKAVKTARPNNTATANVATRTSQKSIWPSLITIIAKPQLPKSPGPRHRWVFGSRYRFPPQPPKLRGSVVLGSVRVSVDASARETGDQER